MQKKSLLDMYHEHKELVSYLFFGVVTTGVNWVVYSVMVSLLGANVNASNVVAWIVAIAVAYVTNKIFVFESRSWEIKDVLKEIALFVVARILSGIVELFGFPLLYYYVGLKKTLFGVNGLVAKIVVSIIVIIMNYVLSKVVVFRKN